MCKIAASAAVPPYYLEEGIEKMPEALFPLFPSPGRLQETD